MRDIWIHLHIPKCGGTSIGRLLKKNFKQGFLTSNSILNDYQYSSLQIDKIISLHPYMTCLTGHKMSLDLPYERSNTKLRIIIWIRDPLQRFISHYYFHRHKPDINKVKQAEEMDLLEYTDWALKQGHQQAYINGQLKHLMGSADEEQLYRLTELMEIHEIYLFPMEKIGESFVLLNMFYPHVFHYYKMPHLNKSPGNEQFSAFKKEEIESFFKLDRSLHELAYAQFARYCSSASVDEEQLAKRAKQGLLERLFRYDC